MDSSQSFEFLAEEAAKGGAQAGQDLERKIEQALACPCLDDIREGPCWKPFEGAFSCYIRKYRTTELDGCYAKFEVLHRCMADNANAFSAFYGNAPKEEQGAAAAARAG